MRNEEEIEHIIEYIDELPRYVMGFDPGGTTGVALLSYTEHALPELIYLDQVPDGLVGFYDEFSDSFPQEHVDVVSESWVEHNVKGADRVPLEIQGVQYALWQGSIFYQQPILKQIVSDEKLKQNNLWVTGNRHAMDALIHAIVWLFRHGHVPTQKMLAEENESPMADKGEARAKLVKRDEDGQKSDDQGEPGEGEPGEGDSGDDFEEIVWGLEKGDGKERKHITLNQSFSGYDVDDSEFGEEVLLFDEKG